MRDQLRVFRHTCIAALAELRQTYTWRTWIIAWLLRLLFQVGFFASLGLFVGSDEVLHYLVVGNAVVLVALEATVVILASVTERQAGTLPMLVASPAGHLTVFLGRGVHWLATGMLSSSITLFGLAPLLGVQLPARAVLVLPMLALVGVSAYCYGAAIGSLVLRFMELRWMALNVAYMSLMAFAGVNVPVDFWPRAVQTVAQVLPVTHGLAAIRLHLAGGPAIEVATRLGGEALVAAGWLAVAVVSYRVLAERGRSDGSIEYSI